MPRIPPPEQVRDIVHGTIKFFRALEEGALVEGLPPPPLMPEAIQYERAAALWHLTTWELALNPERLPLRDGMSRGISGWPDAETLGKAIDYLYQVRQLVLTHWGLEAIATAPSWGVNIAPPKSKLRKRISGALAPGHVYLEKVAPWPPPVPLLWDRQATHAVELLAACLDAPDAPPPKGRPGRRGYSLEALRYAKELRRQYPNKEAKELRAMCLKKFSKDDLPPDADSFRSWLNRKRTNQTN
jgi:hypothetical protein